MKAKVLETCAGINFRAEAGTVITDDVYGLEDNHILMKKTDIQSIINRGSAIEIKEKPKRKS